MSCCPHRVVLRDVNRCSLLCLWQNGKASLRQSNQAQNIPDRVIWALTPLLLLTCELAIPFMLWQGYRALRYR